MVGENLDQIRRASLNRLAETAYEAYFDGKPHTPYSSLSETEQAAWRSAVQAAVARYCSVGYR
jgi:hypothetical protein